MKHNTSIPSSHWIFVYHVKKKNHLQNEAKVPLSIRALVPNASNLHSNIVWKTHFSKLLSLEFTFVNSNYTKKKKRKKKKYVKNRKWWRSWDKLNVAFLHWRCCLQKFLERRCDLRLVHVRQTLQLARSLCWKTSLSLLYCKLQPAMYKRMAALVSYDFSNSFLIDVIHAPRIYPIPDVSLV